MIDWNNIEGKFIVLRNGYTFKVLSHRLTEDDCYPHFIRVTYTLDFSKFEHILPIHENFEYMSYKEDGNYVNHQAHEKDIVEVAENIEPKVVNFIPAAGDRLVSSLQDEYIILDRMIKFGGDDCCLFLAVKKISNNPLEPFQLIYMNPINGKTLNGINFVKCWYDGLNSQHYYNQVVDETFGMF